MVPIRTSGAQASSPMSLPMVRPAPAAPCESLEVLVPPSAEWRVMRVSFPAARAGRYRLPFAPTRGVVVDFTETDDAGRARG